MSLYIISPSLSRADGFFSLSGFAFKVFWAAWGQRLGSCSCESIISIVISKLNLALKIELIINREGVATTGSLLATFTLRLSGHFSTTPTAVFLFWDGWKETAREMFHVVLEIPLNGFNMHV